MSHWEAESKPEGSKRISSFSESTGGVHTLPQGAFQWTDPFYLHAKLMVNELGKFLFSCLFCPREDHRASCSGRSWSRGSLSMCGPGQLLSYWNRTNLFYKPCGHFVVAADAVFLSHIKMHYIIIKLFKTNNDYSRFYFTIYNSCISYILLPHYQLKFLFVINCYHMYT